MEQPSCIELSPLQIVAHQADHYQLCCCRNARAHYLCSDAYQRRHLYIGIPAILISAVVGTTIFASLSRDGDFYLKILAGTLSLLAAALASLQTFMNFDDKSKEHKASGNRFSSLRREFELYLLGALSAESLNHTEQIRLLKLLTDKFSEISSEVPKVPERIWRQANREVPVPEAHLSPVAVAMKPPRLGNAQNS